MMSELHGIQETAQEWIEAWDRGEIVWTVEMGGIGPGYEQALQECAVELVRGFLLLEDWDWEDYDWDELKEHRQQIFRDKINPTNPGLSGAQVGAATHIAVHFCRCGPNKALNWETAKDRKIMIQKPEQKVA